MSDAYRDFILNADTRALMHQLNLELKDPLVTLPTDKSEGFCGTHGFTTPTLTHQDPSDPLVRLRQPLNDTSSIAASVQ